MREGRVFMKGLTAKFIKIIIKILIKILIVKAQLLISFFEMKLS